MTNDVGGIQVIARAAVILRALGREGVSLGALAKRTGLPRSTVQRIVDALAAENFVEAGETGVRLGWGLGQLTQIAQSDVVLHARPYLQALYEATHETVDISMRRGAEVSFLDRIVSDQELRVVPINDKPRPLHAMANGKAMLAGMTNAEVERLMDGKLVDLTDKTITTLPALLADLAQVRISGFSYDQEEHMLGVCALGSAIRVPGLPTYAVSIAIPASRFELNLEMFQRTLRIAQKGIEAALAKLQSTAIAPVK